MKIHLEALDGIDVQEDNGFIIIDPQYIGHEVALQLEEKEDIWQSDIIYEIELYFNEIINTIFDYAIETLEKKDKKIDTNN